MTNNYTLFYKLNFIGEQFFLKKYFSFALLAMVLFSSSIEVVAQDTFTLGDGTESYNVLGVSPFATINRNNRSQYIYYAEELYNQGFNISGNVVSIALNITELALPTTLKPENIKIKMGMTTSFEAGPNLIPNLPVYYESSIENITATGWYTFELDTPFSWDGFRNIIVEICRENEDFGTSFSVQGKDFPLGELVCVANYTNDASQNGCSLPNENLLASINMRRRPNMQFTLTNPCEATPSSGQTIVSSGPYCDGVPFILSVQNGSIESGLSYQWQSAPNENGPWSDIFGATDAFFVTSQSIATYYRRATTCDIASSTIFDFPLLVGGEGCYCTSLVVSENAIGITNVTLQSINNSSSSLPSYSNFTVFQTELEMGSTNLLSVNVNTLGGSNYTKAWFDWNNDGAFEESEGYDLGTVTGGSDVNSGIVASITVPANAVLGSTIMRVRTKQSNDNDYPNFCDSIENGEAEDYTVLITESLSLGENLLNSESLIIASDYSGIHLLSKENTIQYVAFYDLSGRLVFNKKIDNQTNITIRELTPSLQLWIVKVSLSNGHQISKKIIY